MEAVLEFVTSVAKQQNLGIEQLIWLQRITSEYCGSPGADELPQGAANAADAPRLSPSPEEAEEAEAAKSPTEGRRRLIDRGISRVDV